MITIIIYLIIYLIAGKLTNPSPYVAHPI